MSDNQFPEIENPQELPEVSTPKPADVHKHVLGCPAGVRIGSESECVCGLGGE